MKAFSLITLAALAMFSLSASTLANEAKQEKAPDTYPLETCVVSGQKLGSMGEPHVIQHEGREIRMCCARCEPRFKRDPAKYLKVLDEAVAKRAEAKPAEKKSAAACCPGH